MSTLASSVSKAVQRLSRHNSALKVINLTGQNLTDAELAELVDCLLAHPDVVTDVYLGFNQLTDETGVKLARYLAASSTVQLLNLRDNQLGEATYLALAAALRVNASLQELSLHGNQVERTGVDAAFIDALRLNPDRPAHSEWYFISPSNEFERLKDAGEQLGHPSLQMLLALTCWTIDSTVAKTRSLQ